MITLLRLRAICRKSARRLSFCLLSCFVYLSCQAGCSNALDMGRLGLGRTGAQQIGTVLVYVGDRVESLDLATKSLSLIVAANSSAANGSPGMASFSPDGSAIIFKEGAGGGGDSLVLLNLKNRTRRRLLKMAYLDGPRWSPDGTTIVFEGRSTASGEYSLYRYRLEGGALTTVIKGQLKGGEMLFSWASDGKGIVYQDANNGVYVLDLASGARTRIDSGWFPTASPNHRYIAYRADEAGDPGYIIYDVQTRKKQRILAGKSVYRSLVWSPDSRCLIYSADGRGEYYGDLFILDLESKTEIRVLRLEESVYPTDWAIIPHLDD
jgi:Tol biopolymer transport system component